MNFVNELEKNEKVLTENGAVSYKTSGSKLVDLNFGIPKYRKEADLELFNLAYCEDKALALKWLLFLRDVRGGAGERKSFREFTLFFFNTSSQVAYKFLEVVPIAEYGRWDDVIWLWDRVKNPSIRLKLSDIICSQLWEDLKLMKEGKPISLLAKWMPSISTSSKETCALANRLAKYVLGVSPKEYRKTLSKLRKYLKVVETKISANEWSEVDYNTVPSGANLKYAHAFMNHDRERRQEYLESLRNGEAKINANALFLHDIVHKYTEDFGWYWNNNHVDVDDTLEALWNAQEKVEGFANTLVVRDGSGSMTVTVSGNTTAMDIGDALTLYCAENNTGIYKNKFVTFASNAEVIDISNDITLLDELKHLRNHTDCTTTNIEGVFNLILDTAKKTKATQEDLPKNVLIISD